MSVQLFLWLFAVVLLAAAVAAYVNIRRTADQWTQSLHETVTRTSELIKRSVRYGMLLNRKDDVRQTIMLIGESTGLVGVRIYDTRGTIVFSANQSEIGRQVNVEAEACVVCHERSAPFRAVASETPVRVFSAPDGTRILGLTSPIENETACSRPTCHPPPHEQAVLGMLDVTMSMAYADERLAATQRQMIVAALVMAMVIGLSSALFIHRVVRRPVRTLVSGTERIARGDLATRIQVNSRNEIGQLAMAFNRMVDDISRARQEITEWSQTLEQKVISKTRELSQARRQMVHMEKMASLGKLAAAVAHELNNPLSAILMYARLVARDLPDSGFPQEQREELCRYLRQVETDAARCGDVVRNLLLFARPSGGEFALQHLNHIVESSVTLVRHRLQMAHVELETDLLEGDDAVACDAEQLQQAFVALLVNAVEAMPGGGRLSVRTRATDGTVRVEISDTGVSIPEEMLPHVFEPFVSTKDEQSGVGLGLPVVYGIVQRHAGDIDVESAVGKGTTVRVVLPRRPSAASGEPAPHGTPERGNESPPMKSPAGTGGRS